MDPKELLNAIIKQRDQMIAELSELDGRRDQLRDDIAKLTFFINRSKTESEEAENNG